MGILASEQCNTKRRAEPEKKQTAEHKKDKAEPETKWTAECEKYQVVGRTRNETDHNLISIKQSQKRNGLLKDNGIGILLNLVAWRMECDTGRLNMQWNAIERELSIKSPKGMSYMYMYLLLPLILCSYYMMWDNDHRCGTMITDVGQWSRGTLCLFVSVHVANVYPSKNN